MKRLANKVAVVTGSSSGIGKAIALRFGEGGAKVVVAARRKSPCEQTAKQIRHTGGEAVVEAMNVNLRGTFLCCLPAFKLMKTQG